MKNICRLCLGNVPDTSVSLCNDSASHESKIKFVLPEIDLSITPNFDLCYQCTHLLCTAYSFMRGCIQTEDVIKEYISQNGTAMLSLENVKQYQKYGESMIGNNLVEGTNIKIEIHDEDIKINTDTNTHEIQKSNFTCNRCYIIFNNEDSIEAHQKECSLYQCTKCNEVCSTEDELESHSKIHITERLHICEICKQPFKELSELKHHICKQHNKSATSNVSFQSLDCKTLKHKYNIDISSKNVHSHPRVKIDKGCKNQEYKCKLCNKVFRLRNSFAKHILRHRPKRFVCEICCQQYAEKNLLIKHMRVHTGERPFKCETCGRAFARRSTLTTHMKCVHENINHVLQKPFACEICGRRCTKKGNLKEHMRVHTGERPFKCVTCGKAFAHRAALGVHVKCVHENIKHFVCEICGKSFTIHGKLVRHMGVHTNSVQKTFHCSHESCDKMFNTQEGVRRHMQQHTAIKQHKCTVCDEAFINMTALKIHTQTHTSEKPYLCHICEKAFSKAHYLNVHFKCHTLKE